MIKDSISNDNNGKKIKIILPIITVLALCGGFAALFASNSYVMESDELDSNNNQATINDDGKLLDDSDYFNTDIVSNAVETAGDMQVPGATVSEISCNSCMLEWEMCEDTDYYDVFVLDGTWQKLCEIEDTSYEVKGLSSGCSYIFKVRGVSGESDSDMQYSAFSDEVTAFTHYRAKTTSNVQVYEKADSTSKTIGYIDSGNKLEACSSIADEYVLVTSGTISGYVNADDLCRYNYHEVDLINQYSYDGGDPLPTGCEITSLTVALRYLGFDVTKNQLADDYVDCQTYNADPNYCFLGNPYTDEGSFGTFAPYIAQVAVNFLGEDYKVELHTDYVTEDNVSGVAFYENKLDLGDTVITEGLDIEELKSVIDSGNVAVMWMTSYATEPYIDCGISLVGNDDYTNPDGDDYSITWVNSEHCVVLCGYDDETNEIIIADVGTGELGRYDYDAFYSGYLMLGRQSVVISHIDNQ